MWRSGTAVEAGREEDETKPEAVVMTGASFWHAVPEALYGCRYPTRPESILHASCGIAGS